jgi:HAD superfamily hydrolase (TIGR01509 family)
MQLEAVIFDLDGTLIDSMHIWRDVDLEYLQKRGIEVTPDLFTDMPEGNSFSELAIYVKERFNLTDTIEMICNEWTMMVKDHYENQIGLRPGVQRLLDYLKAKKIKMAIGTSNSLELTSAVLKKNQISDYFLEIVSGDTHLRGKPFPDIFSHTAVSLDVLPQECLVIEDTLVGVKSALSAGMKVLAVQESDSRQDWQEIAATADYTASDFYQIMPIIQKLMER